MNMSVSVSLADASSAAEERTDGPPAGQAAWQTEDGGYWQTEDGGYWLME